ncbi:MAG: glycosyltransferase family 39 protein [Anaerolineae bacterium]|nr:glycosyltransferase family 39 protein [Anaerolineae bacterium]
MLLRLGLLTIALTAGVVGLATNRVLPLLAALALGALAFYGQNEPSDPLDVASLPSASKVLWAWLVGHRALTLGVMAAIASGLASWLARRGEWSPTAHSLWALSLVLIGMAALVHDHVRLQPSLSMAALRRREVMLELGVIAAVTAVGFVLRAYELAHFPPPMHGDEGEMGLMALQILEGPGRLPLFVTGWLDHPTLFHYLQAASMAIFGRDEVGLRMLSAIFGSACVPLIYWIGRVGWGRLAGFTAAWLMAVSHLHIHFSRIGLNNIESVFGMTLFMWLLTLIWERGEREQKAIAPLRLFVGAGLVAGLSQYLYYGSRLIPVVATPLLLVLWLRKRANPGQLLALASAALIAFAPLGGFYLNHWASFMNRMRGVSVFQAENLKHTLGPNAAWPTDLPVLLKVQVERNLRFFVRDGDASSFYLRDIPAFDGLTVVLLWLGLGAALTRVRRYHELALLSWFGVGILFAGILTIDSPNAPRLIVIAPSVYLLGGVFVHRARQLLTDITRVRLDEVGALILGIGMALTLLTNVYLYFVDYARKAPNLAPIMVAREISVEPERYQAYLIGSPILFAEHGVIRFVARRAHVRNLDDPNALSPPDFQKQGLLVIALAHRADELQAVEARFPGGVITSYSDPLGRLIYVAYRVPPQTQ